MPPPNLSAFDKFKNVAKKVGPLEMLFGGMAVKDILTSQNKLKSFFQTIYDFSPFAFVQSMGLMGSSMRSLIKESGSLEAALRKMYQVQEATRQFAPLLGGLDAAKRKVAELYAFARNSNGL